MHSNFSRSYLTELKDLIDRFQHEQFERVLDCLLDAYENGNNIFVMGNGGSGSTASHLACDINKGACFGLDKRFRVICLNDNIPTMLAYANDLSYQDVFVEQLKNFLQPGDVVLGISGSGNSENVIRAVRYASEKGGKTIGLCGFKGGRLAEMVDVPLIAESDDMQKIEDVHMIVVHMLMQALCRVIKNCLYEN
ncbi:SIS domain-containing protein [bacterium]|nr:SIS domain-containing protein [bacterium]